VAHGALHIIGDPLDKVPWSLSVLHKHPARRGKEHFTPAVPPHWFPQLGLPSCILHHDHLTTPPWQTAQVRCLVSTCTLSICSSTSLVLMRPPEHGGGREVAPVAGVRGAHHVRGVPHLLRELGDGERAVVLRALRREGRKAHHEEVQAREGDEVSPPACAGRCSAAPGSAGSTSPPTSWPRSGGSGPRPAQHQAPQ